ncbi:MAG: hypothetical protein M0Z99_13895 [Betaproteobacteria bacterium]|nr:hypothetical protein [Betaproteobacteria bacterium]
MLTHHVQARLQQRGIPPMVLESLLDFGHEAHDHHGSRIVYFDHRARQQLRRQVGTESYKRSCRLVPMPGSCRRVLSPAGPKQPIRERPKCSRLWRVRIKRH